MSAPRQDLKPLLNAQSVAIVGISELPRFGGVVHANLRAFGYAGKIFGVNPKYRALNGMTCYPSLRELPERPDLAILALPNARLLEALTDAAAVKIPAAVIFASAYSEPTEGQPSLQSQLKQAAEASGMVFCGPNCMGLHAFVNRLVISGYPIAPTPAGNVTFITHSGSQFDALWQNKRGIHFNYLVSAGNEIVTTLADYMQFALDEATTRAIGLFMETVRDPQTFMSALKTAAERDIPIVALKVGRSTRGAELAQAHSGALAGQDAVYDALFKYYGVQRVKSPDEMLDTLELFSRGYRTPTKYIASLHDSGGERGLLVDLAEQEGVAFADMNAATTQRLSEILEPGLEPVNPVDAWGTGNEYDRIYRECLLALDADPATGLTAFAVDLYASDDTDFGYLDVAAAALPHLTKPFVFVTNLAASADDSQIKRLREMGIPVLMGTENGIRAIKHLLGYCEFQREKSGVATKPVFDAFGSEKTGLVATRFPAPAPQQTLDEYHSKQVLSRYGITIPREQIAACLKDALQAVSEMGYPIALKTAEGELHKSDKGGVKLNLQNADELTRAYQTLEKAFGSRVLVQEMIPRGVELILGIVNDAQFGPMLAIGLGGILVEVFKDSQLLMLPTTRRDVCDALMNLRGAKLLQGVRGHAPVNLEAIVDAAMGLADLAQEHADEIKVVDINPLIALPDRAVAADALIITK